MVNIKIFFAVLLVNIYPQMSASDQMNCPLLDINFSGNDLACIRDVSTYHDCGKLCHNMYLPDSCRYWSWYSINHYCCLKHSDSGLTNNEDWISGDSNCYWCHELFKKGYYYQLRLNRMIRPRKGIEKDKYMFVSYF